MKPVISSLASAFAQLADRAVVRVAAKSIAITVAFFAAFGAAAYAGIAAAIDDYGLGGGWAALFAALVLPIAVWFLFRLVAVAVLQFFADEIVAAVEAKHYPEAAARAQPLPLPRDFANALRGFGRAAGYTLLALPVAGLLTFTWIGPAAVLLLVNAVLLGRELTDMAWLRHEGECAANPVPKAQRFALGAAIAGLMLVPVANLIAPVVGAAAGTHLAQRALTGRAGRETANA